jgi:hypothetical protein
VTKQSHPMRLPRPRCARPRNDYLADSSTILISSSVRPLVIASEAWQSHLNLGKLRPIALGARRQRVGIVVKRHSRAASVTSVRPFTGFLASRRHI